MTDDQVKTEFWRVVEAFEEPAVLKAFKSVEEKIPLGFMRSTIDQAGGTNAKIISTVGVAERLKLNVEIINSDRGNVINFTMLPIQIMILKECKTAFEELVTSLHSSVKLGFATQNECSSAELVLKCVNDLLGCFTADEMDAVEFLRNTFGHFYADSYHLSWDDKTKRLTELRRGRSRTGLKASIASTLQFTDNDIEPWAKSVAEKISHGVANLQEATVAWSKVARTT